MSRPAFLNFNDWAGLHAAPILVVGETPKRYRIQSVNGSTLQLAGRCRYLRAGETALVPKSAVSFPSSPAEHSTKPMTQSETKENG